VSEYLPPALLDVIRGAANGETIADTAARRVVSPHTVKSQRRDAMRELGAKTMPHAVAIVVKERAA
jgi:DNA-binding CsgD family transcriptional regulator